EGEGAAVAPGAHREVVQARATGGGAVHAYAVVLDLDRHPAGRTRATQRDPHLDRGGPGVTGGVGQPLPDDGDDVVGDVVVDPGVELGRGGRACGPGRQVVAVAHVLAVDRDDEGGGEAQPGAGQGGLA